MKAKVKTPTVEQFKAFESAYDYFNKALFGGALPGVILNLSRKSKAAGFVAPFRWRKAGASPGRGTTHELSINPEILCMPAVEVYSTLVHEQCHIWQHEHGKPSRSGYHNSEWASKMASVGLVPSDTGKPGGNMTGQHMSDYPADGGAFIKALEKMPEKYKLPFVSIEGDYFSLLNGASGNGDLGGTAEPAPGAGEAKPPKKNKVKYSCGCGVNVWGKPGLHIICADCEGAFEAAS